MCRLLCCCVVVLCLLPSCRHEEDTATVVARVAEEYYSCLLRGDYASFVEGTDGINTWRTSAKEACADNLKMFLAAQQEQRQGITAVAAQSVVLTDEGHAAQVFLVVSFGDDSEEVVCQTMVERGGVWYLQ